MSPESALGARHLLETRHGAMHVRTVGHGDPPLLLLHMTPLSGRMFRTITPLLQAERMLVIPDRIGFGHSDPLPGPIGIPDYAHATLDALDGLGTDVVDVVGMHTGSCEAIELAAVHADRVRRVGVVALPAFAPDEVEGRKRGKVGPPPPELDGSHLRWYWDWWVARSSLGDSGSRAEVARLHQRVLELMSSGPEFWWTYHAVYDYPTVERLERIRQPLLVLVPHDDLVDFTLRAIPALPPQAQVVELPHLTVACDLFDLAAEELAGHIRAFST